MTLPEWKTEKEDRRIMFVTEIGGIEVAFQDKHNFDTKNWHIRFDVDGNSVPRIIQISRVALKGKGLASDDSIIVYIKEYIPRYLESIDYDFNKISKNRIIKSRMDLF